MNVISNRLGRFSITIELLKENKNAVQCVMSKCIPVRCEYFFGSNTLEYTAISEEFLPLEEGETAPLYTILITDNEDESFNVKFVRQ